MQLQCPYCDIETRRNAASTTDQPCEDFESHYIGVTCSECGEYYEIMYCAVNIMYWEDNDDPRTAY